MFIANKKQEYWWYFILSIIVFFSFYYAIGSYPLFDNNEGLYASIGKHMLLYKKFIIPHLNCVPYIEKPPLLYWLLSSSFSFLGFTAFAARFVTVTSAALICVAILFFAKKIREEQIGIISALIFASSIGVSIIARMVYFDMLFTFLISGALFCLFYWYESKKISALRISYLFLGLAVLAKGLIAGVVVWGSFSLFLIIERDFRRFYKALDPVGIVLFFAVVLPWHIAAVLEHKGFFWSYIVEEHFLRFLDQREPHDYYHGPIYYYLPRMMIYLFPWSFFAPLIFWKTKNISLFEKRFLRFNWCWLLVPLVFFSLSSAKANYYMIVSMPALALMLGIKLIHLAKHHSKVFHIWSASVLFVVALIIGVVFGFIDIPHIREIGWRLFFGMGFYGIIASAATLFVIRKPALVAALISALIVPLVFVMVSYVKVIKSDLSVAEVGLYLSEHVKDRSLYLYQDFENISALAFYAPDCFKMIESRSNDLYYGQHLPQFRNLFLSKKEFLQEDFGRQVYIVVPAKKLEQFYQDMDPAKFSVLKRFDRVQVLTFDNRNQV